jgi:hypothetical protein
MMKSVASVIAGIMFIMGVILVSSPKIDSSGKLSVAHLKPSAVMLRLNSY